MSYCYLASPYSHPDPDVREERYLQACQAAGALMELGSIVLSPIAHSHPIEKHGIGRVMPGEFWKRQDVPLLRHADELIVLCLDGWEESVGMRWEITMAHSLNIPIQYLSLDEIMAQIDEA